VNECDRQIDELFEQALERPPAEQQRFVEEACGGDAELADTLVSLLAAATDAEDFLGESAAKLRDRGIDAILAAASVGENDAAASDRTGSRIGPYRILGRLGRGGRSTVWKAERTDEEWQQQVAIKILRRGFDTDDVVARFVAERQILLLLDHPGIATILDGGTTDDGLPYFVMPLIEGDRITEHARRQRLPLDERLRLLIDVAGSVAFAHRHLVVHRDIKPSNILVTRDGRPILLDFGIAKVVDPGRADIVGARTLTEMRVLTPDYASPEQRAGEAITTASDVYQLGLLMVELLAGVLPDRSGQTLELPPLSRLLAGTADTSTPYAATRLRGDIDMVARKALRPEPEERYRSMLEFIDDLQALLEDRPVRARAPSARYRLAKFIKRQPWAAPVAILFVLTVAGAIFMNASYTRQVESERDRAESIKSFLVEFLRTPDPFEGEGRDVTVQEALETASYRAGIAFADRHELHAEIVETLADVYTNLDRHATARELRERRIDLLRTAAADSFTLLTARIDVAGSMVAEGDAAEARDILAVLIEELETAYPRERAALGRAHLYAGRAEKDYGDVETGAQHLGTAVELFRRAGERHNLDVARALHDQASAYNMMDRADEALAAIDEAIVIRSELYGNDALPTLLSRVERATTLDTLHDYDAAAQEYDALVATLEDALGALHNFTLTTLNNEAVTLVALKRHAEAEEIYREVLARKREKFAGKPAATIAVTLQNIATLLSRQGRDPEAVPLLFEVRDIFASVLEPGNYRNAYPDLTLSRIYARIGDYEAMAASASSARRILEASVPEGHPAREMAGCRHGEALLNLGQVEAGRALLKAAISRLEAQESLPAMYIDECRKAIES